MTAPRRSQGRKIWKFSDHIGIGDRRTEFGLLFEKLAHVLYRRFQCALVFKVLIAFLFNVIIVRVWMPREDQRSLNLRKLGSIHSILFGFSLNNHSKT